MSRDSDDDTEVGQTVKEKKRQVWTEKEKVWILEYISQRASSSLLLKNPSNEKAGNKKALRETQLAELYEEFMVNGSPTQRWTALNIRTLLKNLKSAGTTARSAFKAHIRGTGGGAAKKLTRLEELLVELGDESAEPLTHQFDSDAGTSRATVAPDELTFSRRKGTSASATSRMRAVNEHAILADPDDPLQVDDITEILSHTGVPSDPENGVTPPPKMSAKRISTSPIRLAGSKKMRERLSPEDRFIVMRETEHVLKKRKLEMEIELIREEKDLNKKRMELLDLQIANIRPAEKSTVVAPVQTISFQRREPDPFSFVEPQLANKETLSQQAAGSVFHPSGFVTDPGGQRWPFPARLTFPGQEEL